jgi:hypothetical protein
MNTQTDIDPTSQKLVSTITSFFTYFSIVIILFLILSYVGNQYIPGIGLMFLPMWITNGGSFYKKPCLGSLFHKPSKDIPESRFITKDENGLTKYRLLEMGPNFYQAILGIANKYLPQSPEIHEVDIVLQDYDDEKNIGQKLLLIIFGSLQMFIGSLMTLFSSVAYLFSGKHGMFFNMQFEKEQNKEKTNYFKMFKELDKESMSKSGTDKILIKSGWSKFAAAFGFAYFIPVDKLTYGTQFYITEKSSFVQRFQYFFFIMLIMLFIGTLPSSFQGGTSGIAFGIIFGIIMYTIFAKRVYNEEYQTDPFPNMSSLLDKYKSYYEGSDENKKIPELDGKTLYNRKKTEYTDNNLSDSIDDVKKKLQQAIDDYSKAYKNIDPTLKLKNNSENNSEYKLSNEQVSFLSGLLENEQIDIDNIKNTRKKVLTLIGKYHPNKSKNENAEEISRKLVEIKNKLNKKGIKYNKIPQIEIE